MLLSNILSFTVTVSGLLSVALAQAPLTPGKYRIWNGPLSARSFPSGPQGHSQSEITFSDEFVGVWENWELVSDGGDGFFIQSVGTGARAYAAPITGTQVVAASNRQSSWLIQGGGQTSTLENLYTVKLSAGDFLWTNTPRNGKDNAVTLQGSDGSSSQRFIFRRI